MSKIDDAEQGYTADLLVSVSWRDPRLVDPNLVGSDARRRVLRSSIWTPEPVLLNQRSDESLLSDEVVVDPDGNVLSQRRLYQELASPFDLRDFPFDSQVLPLRVVSARYTQEEVALVADPTLTGGSDRFSVAGWALELDEVRTTVFVPIEGFRELTEIQFPILADREVGYYMWSMAVPLVLIVLMAWSVFWIDPTLLPSQIGVTTASTFTLIAFRVSMQFTMPRLSYMTRGDYFVLGWTVLVFSALAQAVLTGRLGRTGREDLARRLDRWGRWVYLGALVLLLALTLLW